MAQDKLDILYDALERDGAVTRGRENFRAKMLAPGEEGYKNRLALFTALKQDNAVKSNTYEEFSANLGLHAVKPAKKEDPAEEQGGAAQPNADDYARAAKNNALAVERGRDVLHQAENAQEWQKANFGLNVPKVELGLGKSGRTVASAPTFNAKTGKQERTYITQSGNEYTSQASAEREQAALDKQQEQSRKLAHVQEEIDRKRQEELAGIDKQLTVMREQYDRIKGTDQTSETRRGYIMQAIDRLQQQRDAAEKKYRGRDVKAEYELGGGREQLEAAKEEVAKALEDIEERRGEKSGFMEFAESQFPNVTSYIRRWTDPEYGKAKAAEQALEDTENTIKQATREGFSNNTAFNVARGAWDATRDIRTWDFGANDWADSRNLAELVDKSERIRKAEEAGKTPEEHLTATEQRVLDAMAVSSTLDANFSEHVPMSYRVGQSVPASAGFAASIYLNPLNGLGAAVEKQVAANAAKGGMKEVLKGAMKTAGKTVMKNVTGAPTMNAAEQSMQRALTVAAVNKYGKWGVRAMNTAGRVIGDGVEALGTTLTTGLPRTMASINERQTGTFIGRVDDSGRIVYDRVEDRETGAKSYLKGGLASYFENQSELVGEYFSPIKNFANLAAKDMPLARSMVERLIASSPKQKASLLAEFRKKAHISGLFGEYAEEVINNLENAVFTGDMNLTGGVFEPKREDYQSEEDYNKAVNDWKGSMFNAETNLETFLSVAAMIMPMAAIEQGQKRYNSYTVKRQLNTSADALRKSLGEETAVPLMTRMREAESIKDICDVYMSLLKDGGLKDSEQARALMDYAGKLVAYQSVNTSDMSGEISANRVQRGYKSAFDAGHEMAADERHNAAVEFDNAAATATEMLGKDFVMAVRDMDLPHFQEILKTLNWEQKKAATDVYLSSVRLSGIMAGARDRVDEEADKYGNTLNLMSDEEGNAWRGSNLGENEYVVPSSLYDEGGTLVVRDMETGALRMIPREEAGELTAVNASEETEARRKQLWEQAKDEVRWNLNHHNKTVQPAVGETVSISIRKSEDEDNETQRFLIVKEDEDGNFYLLPTRMNEAGEEEAISGTPFKATADELLSSQDYVYEQEDAVQRDAERSAVEETTEGGATEETPTDGSSVVIEGTPATEEDAPADKAVPTRSEVAAQLDATDEGRSARAMVDGWVRDENDAETIHEWIDIVDESEWDAKTKQLLHDYVDSEDAPDEEGPTGGSSAVVESEAAPVVEGEATPAVESKATPKIPLDKDGAPQYDKAPVQDTVEDLYDGTLDDKEVGEFIEAQIAEADKNVKKLEKRKPKVGTDKAKYLTSKKKWEDELEDASHKAQYWNDVKAEVERITTPADAQGLEGELNDDNARAAYRAQRKAENGIPTQQEFIADFMASAKIAPESFRKETGGGTLEQKQWAGRIAKEGDSIERLSEKLVDLDNTENGGRFFGGDSAAARDAIIDFLKSGRDNTNQEQEFVEQYNAQRDAYYNERYGMSYEDYIAYTEQEMPEMLRRYSNFDEQEFTNLYADEIEEDLRRREEQAKQQNNGTEGNDSAGEEQSDGGSHQVQPGERTDDTRGGEERTDTRAEEDAGDEGAGKPEAAQENTGAEAAGGRTANVGGTPELQGDIPSEERVAKREKSSATNEHDSQGNPLNADGTLKLEKVESIDGITDEDFSHPTRNVELPKIPEAVDNALGAEGKPVIIKKNIFERNAERHKDLSPSQSRGILFSALYNADLYGQNQKAKRPYNWVVINTKDEKGHNRIVLLEINPSKNAVEIVHWHYVNDKNLELIKKQAIREGGQVLILPSENSEEVGGLSNLTDGQQVEKNDGELVMLSSKDKVESLSTPQHDLSSDGKGSTKLPTEQEKGNIIPPSKRFNSRKADERYQRGKGDSPATKEEAILRDAVIDRMRENGMDVITNEEEGQRVMDEANGKVRTQMGDAPESFAERQKQAVENRGIVMPGLNDMSVKVLDGIPRHSYTGNIAEATKQAIQKAKEKYAPDGKAKVLHYDNNGTEFDYTISGNAIEICLSPKHQAKSGNKGAHLALAEHLDEVINHSVEVEEHPDYIKGKDGKRGARINPIALMHRFYGAVVIDGVPCRVMTLMREEKSAATDNGIHSYEVQKIEVLDNELPSTPNGVGSQNQLRLDSSYPLAKLLKGVEKSYDKGKKLLEESEKSSAGIREHRVWHGSGAEFEAFDHSHIGEGEGAQAYGWGTYVTEVEGIGKTYAEDTNNKLFRSKFGSYYLQKLREALNNGRSFESEKQRLLDSHSEMYNKAKEKGSGYNDFIHDYEKLGELKENDLPSRHLYTVEITDDNGKNYLDWDKSLAKEELEKVIDAIMASPEDALKMLRRAPVRGSIDEALDKYADNPDSLNKEALKRMLTKYLNGMQFGYVYKEIADVIGKEQTSKLLSGIGFVGIKYPADSMRGGRADGAKNYVIFNEKDAKITDHVRFFRTADGEAYGFTVDGKIYIDPKIANSETPVHEYAHLWASALRQSNAKEWANVVVLMKNTAVWEEVKKHYPELNTDDEIADEVLATYSGRRGAERLRKEMEEATKNGSIFDKAEAMNAMQKIRQALTTFWKSVADFLHIHYNTAEEVADRVMKDLLDGVDPRMMNDGESVESIHYQHVESKEYESLERANERFNDELDAFKNKSHKGLLHLGRPGAILRAAGIDVESITLSPTVLNRHLNKHALTTDDLKGLAKSIQSPILVYKHGKNSPNIVVVTELGVKGGKLSASFELDSNGEVVKVSNISSIHNKDAEKELLRLYKMGEKDFRNALKWVEKEKMLNWLAPSSYKPSGMQTNEAPFDIAKVIQDFENPKVSDEKVSEDDLYRVVDDKETIDRLDVEPKITAYRAMQVIDGKLYSPMAAKVDGKLTDSNPHGEWTEAEETLFDFTPEQKAAMEALDKSNEPGNVELIKGKLRYNKQSKNGKGTFQFHLVKGDGSSLWAAYNPYIHSSLSMLNDQFTSAYKRPNIVVVEVEIPESELTSGYRAQNAKNTVGMTEWKAGPVAGQLPGDMARQVMLSRWSKVKRIVPYSEVADQVAATLSTAEEKTGQKVQLPIESFHPELRKELEKRGFEFQHGKYTEETANRKAWDDLTDEEKQQAYKGASYMDDAAIEALNSEYRGEWLKREGEGQATDEEVSLANDPVSKMIGKSRYSAGQQVEYAENMRERMTTHAQELAEKLHLSNVEIVADGSVFTGKRQKAKGFYNKTTGKITVIIGNHSSMADVEKTILHEAVAHHGLRQLFGEHFDQFLDNVYESCDYKIRQKIDALMEEKGYDQRTATEEYLASLAEDMNYETTDPTFWTAIKEAFLDMLHTLGFDYAGPVLTDNELRYILWRSYKNLEEPGSFRSILGTAEDLKMQETLGVGQYETEGKESAAAEDLFREDDISRALNNDSEGAGWSRETMQRAWDDVMSKASFLAKEGYFDYLASVDEFQKLVERATGEKVSDMQNAYKAMLQLSSRNANEMKLFDSAFARPLQRAVYWLIGAVKDFKKGKGLELSWYLISKHGIERNRDMAIRAAMKEKAKESFAEQIHEATAELKEERTQLLAELTRIAAGEESTLGTEAAIKARVKQIEAEIDSIKKHPNKHGLKTEAEFYEDELYNWYRTASFIKEYAEENGWTWRETQEELTRRATDFGADVTEDYSGLSALVEEEEDFTEAAYRRVENYENAHYTDDLWEAIRAMSGYSLEKQRSSGLTTKKYVDDQLRRYDFFVPLRGWADPTAEEMYDYLDGQRSELGNPVKTAKGRKSEADNPLGGLLSVAYRSIASGNKNMALQHFYNLVSAHNTSGLAVIDSMWIENRGTEDAPDWVLATPELTDPMTGGREMSAEEVQAELDRFNADMREKAALGMAIQMKKGTPLPPYRVTQQHARAHQIRLSVGGTNRVITIVGNPRVAMALNGLLNPENSGWPILRKLNNFMAGAFTNYNVSFGGANLARDTAHSNLRAFIGESPAYWWALTKKQNLMLGNVANWARMVGMLRKYEAGKPMTGYHERMFKEFMDGGGATGYTMIRNQKESTQFMVDMVRDLKNIKRRKLSPMRMFEFFSFLNEAAELVNRFVAYETSREMGRTRERSIDDAKEATLNFNRKGAGAKSLTQREGAKYRLSNALNYYSQYGRSFIVFFNAHVQGTYQLYRLVKEHPAKFAFAFGAAPVTAAAVALPLFNNLLLPAIYSAVGGDGDDDWGDYYYELSDWERQHNICLRLPKGYGWLKIPLTPELGAMFQVGDVTGASFAGKRDMQASDFAGIMELVAPNNVDFTDAGTAISSFVPSSLQWASHIAVNRDFKGSRLRNDNMFSRYQPEYLKATRSTSATITAMSRALNKVGGGNDERSADNVLDFSPGYVQEMLTGIAGGWASTALAVSDALAAPYLEGGGSEKDYWKGAKGLFDRGGVPVLSRFWISGSGERNAARAKGEYMRTVKPFMGATESEFSLIKRIPRPAALDVRAKEEKLEAAKKSHDLFAIAEAEKSLEAAKANFEEAKKTQRQKLDALQGSERFKAYRDMRGITRYIDYMLRLYKDNDLPDNVVDSLQEANRRLLDVEK